MDKIKEKEFLKIALTIPLLCVFEKMVSFKLFMIS